jgi:hypothetical protein
MIRSLVLMSIFTLATAGTAMAKPALDSAGKCRDNGRFVEAKACTTAVADKCRDVKTKKFAKCGSAGTEPVPTK